jgi:PKD repeat protein
MNPNRPHQVIIATELGVWSTDSLNSAATNWQPSNTGLSNTRTDMLKLRKSDKMVIAATHGRGLFTSDVFGVTNPSANVNFTANKKITYINVPIQFTSTSSGATTYLWNFGDGTTSTVASPIKNYTTAGSYNVTLTINGGPGTLTINNYIKILPYRGVPYLAVDGGNFENNQNDFGADNVSGTPFELGMSTIAGKSGTFSGTNAWVTSLATNYIDNSEAQLLTPNFNCTAAGNYTISFYTKYKVENTYDGFRVEYSTDRGTTWLPLGTTVATNWYDYANQVAGRPFPINQAYYSSATTMSSYVQKSFTTNVFAGQNQVCFRFLFKTDNSVTDVGVAIDNFELNGPVNSALPVSIGNLQAKRIDAEEAIVNWKTYSEKNNKGFEIYKKDATEASWVLIGFITGKINSNEAQFYHFNDKTAGKHAVAYKLKQLDIDGGFKWSKEIIIPPYLEQVSNEVMHILPMGNKEFKINPLTEFNITLWLYDGHGRVIKQLSFEPQQRTINLNEIPDGIYFIHALSKDGKQQVIKLPVF